MPAIIAYHIIFSTYGFWLPNDPRGSGSSLVWARKLRRFGPPTKVHSSRSVARVRHDHTKRLAAKKELMRPAVKLDGLQARCTAYAVRDVADEFGIAIFAAAFMPDHVHLVIQRGRHTAEEWTGLFKRAASRRLADEELHPHQPTNGRRPTIWGAGGWKVYLHTPLEIRRTIRYVRENPIRAGLRAQNWKFAAPFSTPRGRGG